MKCNYAGAYMPRREDGKRVTAGEMKRIEVELKEKVFNAITRGLPRDIVDEMRRYL